MTLAQLIVFLLIVFVVMRPLQAAWLFTRPPRFRVSFQSPIDWGMVKFEPVQLVAADGVRLSGWYIPSQNGAAVLLVHGHGGNRVAMGFQAETLTERGYGVLMFDLRRHGNSGGQQFGLGEKTVGDVQTAVSWLSKRPDVEPGGIGILGVSVGATLALHAAVKNTAVRALLLDAPSPTQNDDLPPPRHLFDRLYLLPLQRHYMTLRRWFASDTPLPANCEVVSRLFPRPLLLISAGRGLEQQLVRHYYAAAREPKIIWELPNASHASGWRREPEGYRQQIVAFFDQYLVQGSDGYEPLPASLIQATPFGTDGKPLLPPDVAYDATLPMGWANGIAFALLPLAYLLLWLPFQWLWGAGWGEVMALIRDSSLLALAGILLGSVLVHELLHALGFVWVGGVQKTAVSFGMNWSALAPYAHCRQPMTTTAYRIAVALPGFVLGLLPALLGLLLGNLPLLLFGGWMLVAAGGDAAVLLAVRHVPSDALVRDHPARAGGEVLKMDETVASTK